MLFGLLLLFVYFLVYLVLFAGEGLVACLDVWMFVELVCLLFCRALDLALFGLFVERFCVLGLIYCGFCYCVGFDYLLIVLC